MIQDQTNNSKMLDNILENPEQAAAIWLYDNFKKDIIYNVVIYNFPTREIKFKGTTEYWIFKGDIKTDESEKITKCKELHFASTNFVHALALCQDKSSNLSGNNVRIYFKRINNKKCEMLSIKSISKYDKMDDYISNSTVNNTPYSVEEFSI